jgi:hypothetical protein
MRPGITCLLVSITRIRVAAVVEFKEGSYLYTGVLMDYEVNERGELDRFLLVQAQRRKLERDRRFEAGA